MAMADAQVSAAGADRARVAGPMGQGL